jgi:pseudouridine synthase
MANNDRKTAPKRGAPEDSSLERLQKVLAARGVASRRAAEELIQEGRISVDGRVVTELGTKVDPSRQEIRVGGRVLKQPRSIYLVLNKPRGYITTASDPEGRRTVYDLLDPSELRERIYPVGRLDMDSEGLLLMTNDGEFANRVAHPRYRLDKEYNALVEGSPAPGALARLAQGGFLISGGRTSPAEVSIIGHDAGGTWVRVVIHEGRKRQVRRMMEEIGHPVRRLRRVRLGPLTLAGLPAATYRPLSGEELLRLRRMVGLAGEQPAETEDQPARLRSAPPANKRPLATATPRTSSIPGQRAPTRTLGEGRPNTPQGRASSGPPERPYPRPTDARTSAKPGSTRRDERSAPDGPRQSSPRRDERSATETRTGVARHEERGGATRPSQGPPRRDDRGGARPVERSGPRTRQQENPSRRDERGGGTGSTAGTGGRGGRKPGGVQPRRTRP